jgi:hypothetical protein
MRGQDELLPTTTVVRDGWELYGPIVVLALFFALCAPVLWRTLAVFLPRVVWSCAVGGAAVMAIAGEPVSVPMVLVLTVVFWAGGHALFRIFHGFWHGLVVGPAMSLLGAPVGRCRHYPRTCDHLVSEW